MDETRLKEIEARSAAARPGPWYAHPYEFDPAELVGVTTTPEWTDDRQVVIAPDDERRPVDIDTGRFIAHARTDVPDLIASVRDLRASLQHMRFCRSCAEGSWSDCPDGRRAEVALGLRPPEEA